jgi:hypothetical protein
MVVRLYRKNNNEYGNECYKENDNVQQSIAFMIFKGLKPDMWYNSRCEKSTQCQESEYSFFKARNIVYKAITSQASYED